LQMRKPAGVGSRGKFCATIKAVATPVRCPRISKCSQDIWIYIILLFDCQGGSQAGGISASAYALARPGAAPLLTIFLKT